MFDNLSIHIKRSDLHTFSILIVEILALVGVWLADIHWVVSAGLSLVILLFSFSVNRRLVFLRHPYSVKGLAYKNEGWFLQLANQKQIHATVKGDVLITTLLIALKFEDLSSRSTYSVALFRDAMDSEEHRRMRVLLKTLSA